MIEPYALTATNTPLNIKCSCQPRLERIPPHEHGIYSVKFRMATMYAVNNTMRENAARKPIVLNFGMTNMMLTNISTNGMNQAMKPENAVNSGDWLICP
jgi:hypothetical protein